MDKKSMTLEEYFTTLRETPAITSGELEAIIDAPVHHPWYHRHFEQWGWKSGMIAAAVGTVLIGMTLLLFGGEGKPKRERQQATASKSIGSSATKRGGKEGRKARASGKSGGSKREAARTLGPLISDEPEELAAAEAPSGKAPVEGNVRVENKTPREVRLETPSSTLSLPKTIERPITKTSNVSISEADVSRSSQSSTVKVERKAMAPRMSPSHDYDTLVLRDRKIPVEIPDDVDNLKYVVPVDTASDQSTRAARDRQPILLNSGASVTTATVDGVRMAELRDDELAKLGVYIRPNGSVVIYVSGSTRSSRNGSTFQQSYAACTFNAKGSRTVAVDRSEIPPGVQPTGFPLYVTDVAGARKLFERTPSTIHLSDAMQSFVDSLDRIELARPYSVHELIPIRINLRKRVMDASEPNYERPDDLVLWYRPSDNLLGRLPSCMRNEVKAELIALPGALNRSARGAYAQSREELAPDMRHIYDSLRAANRNRFPSCSSAATERVARNPYLDMWRSRAGAILGTAVSPDPIGEDLQVSYRLGARRTVRIDLYDVLGRHERSLLKEATIDKGEFSGTYSLFGIRGGIYLVVITTDKGEQGVQRIMVERDHTPIESTKR